MILPAQCEDIIKIAKKLPEKSIVVVIGCAWGRKTWCWLEGLTEGSTLITIDVFMLDEKKGKHKKDNNRHIKILLLIKLWITG